MKSLLALFLAAFIVASGALSARIIEERRTAAAAETAFEPRADRPPLPERMAEPCIVIHKAERRLLRISPASQRR